MTEQVPSKDVSIEWVRRAYPIDEHTFLHQFIDRLAHEPAPVLRPDGMPEPSLDVLKRVAARMRETAPDTAYLAQWAVDQIEEHNQSFDLRWKADMRAIKRWQEAHPGNDLTWPDHADLCVWLLEQLDAARASQPPSDDLPPRWKAALDGHCDGEELWTIFCEVLAAWQARPSPSSAAPKFKVGDVVIPTIAPHAKGDIRVRAVETVYRISVDGHPMESPYAERELLATSTKGGSQS